MKKVLFIFAFAAAVLSCTIENEPEYYCIEGPVEKGETKKLTSLFSTFGDEPETKTVLIDGKSVYWKPADKIIVFNGNKSAVFQSSNTENAASATFTGELEIKDSTIFALYPYQNTAELKGDMIQLTVPSVQHAEAGSFDQEAFVSLAKSHAGDMKFYHLCSLLKLRFSQDGIREVTLAARGGNVMAGTVMVQLDDKSIPSVAECVKADTLVTLIAPGTAFKKNTDYYMVVLPGTLDKGFTMTAKIGTKAGYWEKEEKTTFTRAIASKATNPDEKMSFLPSVNYGAPSDLITVEVAKMGGLEDALSGYTIGEIKALKIKGVLDDVDFLQISTYMTSLEYLDISEVNITTLPQQALYKNNIIKTLLLPETLTIVPSSTVSYSVLETVVFGKALETIEKNGFSNCSKLENVVFPDSIKVSSLTYRSFYNCSLLKEIDIPASVVEIASGAFENCSSLENIFFAPSSKLETIGGLSGLKSLKRIVIPASVKTISSGAFSSCTSLEEVVFEENPSITTVNQWFSGCSSLKEFKVPAEIETVSTSAFQNNTYISKIVFEKGSKLKTIGNNAFYGSASLSEIVFPDGDFQLNSIGECAFYNCSSLKELIIPQCDTLLNTIGVSAFTGCSSLRTIEIPSGITSLASGLFYNCSSLESVVIPGTVQKIENQAFYGCTKLSDLVFKNPAIIESIGDYAFYNNESLTSFPFKDLVILSSIGSYAFSDSKISGDIVFPASLTTIGTYAFYDPNLKNGITKITFPEGSMINSIGNYSFRLNKKLTKLVFEGNGTSEQLQIGTYAFYDCVSLATVDAENILNLYSVGNYAFYNCSSLRLFYNGTIQPATCYSYSFTNIASNAILKVRPESVSKYKSSTGWRSFSSVSSLNGHVSGVALDTTAIRMKVGADYALKATVTPDDATNKKVNWTSSDATIATVDQNGKVTGVAPGDATITATAVDGGYAATCVVTVYKPVQSIILPENIKGFVDLAVTIPVTVQPEDATDKTIEWTVSDEAIATVNDTLLIGKTAGVISLEAKAKDGSGVSAICKVVVVVPVTSIKLDRTRVSMEVGDSTKLTVEEVLPDTADDKSYTWSSSNPSVATVDDSGNVSAVSKGYADIRATANDGSGTYGACRIGVPSVGIDINISYKPTYASYTSSTTIGGNSVNNRYRYHFLDVTECSEEELESSDYTNARLVIPLGTGSKYATKGLNSIRIGDLLTSSQADAMKKYFASYVEYESYLDYAIWNYLYQNGIYYTYTPDSYYSAVCLAYNTTSTSSSNGNLRVNLGFLTLDGSQVSRFDYMDMSSNCGYLKFERGSSSYGYYNGPNNFLTSYTSCRKVYIIDIATLSKIIWNCYLGG